MIGYVEKALNIKRGEMLPAFLLFLYLFLAIGAYMMGKSVGVALYLNAYKDRLPEAIIATALLIGVFVAIYIRASHRVRLEWLIMGTLAFFSLSFVGFWWFTRTGLKLVYPLIYIWVYTVGAMGPTMGWTLANYVLTTREARRVFGFIGAGAILGGTFSGFATALATRHFHAETLLLIVALFLAVCTVLVRLLFWAAKDRLAGQLTAPSGSREAPKNFSQSVALLRKSRYLLLITGLIAVGCTATTIIEYQFSMIAKAAYGTNKAALTAFFGSFYGYMGSVTFVLQLLLTGRLLRSFGIRVTLFLLPVVLLGASAGVLLVPMLLTAGILRGSHYLLRYSVDKSSAELLYLPVPSQVKSQVKSFIDTFIWRVADGVAGVVLWLFANVMKFSPSRISLVNFAFLVGWLGVAYGVRREYLNVLRKAIERRTLDAERTAANVLDATTTEVLGMALEHGDEQQVLYGLSLFELGHEPGWHPVLRGLLQHPSAAVRQRALSLLGHAGDLEIQPQVEKMLGDESPEVRTEALHYLVVQTGRDPLSLLTTETDVPDYSLQGSVVAFLARSGKTEHFSTAQLILDDMLCRTGPERARARAEAARVLGVIPPPSELHSELLNLLRDDNPEVLEQAILSAGKIQGREFLPLVIEKLDRPRLVGAVRAALARYGQRAMGTLRDYLNDSAVPAAIRKGIPEVLARIGTPEAVGVLADSLIQSDPGLRFDVLKALNKVRRRDPSLLPANGEYADLYLAELMGYCRSFQILAAFNPQAGTLRRVTEDETLLTRALRERMDHELERIFRLLALLYPPRDIYNAFVGLTTGRPQLQANALEVLEHLLRPDLYRPLAYALDPEITLPERLHYAVQLCRTTVESPVEALRILLYSEDHWLRACALFTVGEMRMKELSEELRRVPHEGDAVIEETWRWAQKRLAAAATA